ncbi:Mrp/NBP35 family ATP-binding protein [Thermicanus aegyptius]|uniref:Mrp/NBP35 family ATP-binding protein n=1 Tax=Thermicanus aegyptius TaxID=94009 RepID=UPI0004138B9D|nr:Mrp/NBP35 family ATP-binding protein [Thermicanus aegyptius]
MNERQVLEALKDVKDPEINRNLVDLNMIRNIRIEGNSISLDVILTIQGCPLKVTIEEDIVKALKAIGAEEVHVHFGSMTDEERAALAAQLRGGAEKKAAAPPSILAPGSKTTFIAVSSGKGGVGKSTVSVNLAVSLARLGKKVGIIDADIYGFSVPDMMGIEQRPTVIGDMILPVLRMGVQVISMGFFVADNSPVIWRGPMLGKMLRTFFNDVKWDDLDFMILDLPPGTGDMALDVHSLIPQSKEIIVTTPHGTAAFVAARAGAMAMKTKHEILGVVENMAYSICPHCGEKTYLFGKGGGGRLAEELRTEFLAQIPLGLPDNHPSEPDFSPSVYKRDTEIGQIYEELATKVIGLTKA